MINFVKSEHLNKVIDKVDERKECFIAETQDGYTAIDNKGGDAFTEDFKTLWGAIRWCVLDYLTAEEVRKDEKSFIIQDLNMRLEL